ncbi:MAG: hypothetical protein KY466_03955 [Gemmatimonadetes bacterium]|nr:hypothetical protein [Gemmatimonadota bacterium]
MNGRRENVFKRWRLAQVSSFLMLLLTAPAGAQDGNILERVDSIESRMLYGVFDVVDQRGSRFEGDRTNRAALSFPDGSMMVAKWARSATGGEAFNNQPRYEAAAYEIQKLFLDEPSYVVPPTVLRAFPLTWYQRLQADATPTFRNTSSVLVTLQYWLFNVNGEDVWDEDRFARDTAYARHFADLNILTYLIRHNDANVGNLQISRDPANPRVFAVDNGLAFASETSDRGATWRNLRLKRLPRGTVDRLRSITEDDLRGQLEVLAQWEVGADGVLRAVEPTENVSPGRGVRQEGNIIQLGLSQREIRDTWRRLQRLLQDVDRGRYELF